MVSTYWVLAIMIILFMIYKIKRRRFEKCERSMPGPESLPVIGHSYQLRNMKRAADVFQYFNSILDEYIEEGICRIWLGPNFLVGVTDPEFVQIIANNPNSMDKGQLLSVLRDTMNGAFALDACDSLWRDLRRPITRNITKKLLEKEYFTVFLRQSFEFIRYLKKQKFGQELDIIIPISNLILDIFSETHLGVQTNEVRETKFHFMENFDTFMELSICAYVKYAYIWKLFARFMKFGKERETAVKNMFKFNKWVLDERKKAAKKREGNINFQCGKEFYSDFILRYAEEKKIPEIESLRQITDVIAGGTDTSAVITSSALLFLAMHPEIQVLVHQEQFEIFGDSSREPTLEDIRSMEYLKMVIKETMRIIAPAYLFKKCTGDVVLDKYTIPKGTIILICVQSLHNNPKYWKEPKNFYPNHFLPEYVAKRPAYTYIPYGCGSRICPGYKYGLLAMTTILSTLIRNFKFTTKMKFEDISFDYRLFMQINAGYNVTIEARCKN